jgi:hypothetical protein
LKGEYQNNVACRAVSRQRFGIHVSAATDTYSAIEVTVGNGVFYSLHAKGVGRESPFREDLSPEAEE